MSSMNSGGLFLIQVVFNLYIWIVMLRLVLQWLRANYYNPICQLILKLTDPILKPLKSILPNIGSVDSAGLILLFVLSVTKFYGIFLLASGGVFPFYAVLIPAIADLFNHLINIFFYAILFQVLLSWVAGARHSPLQEILYVLTEPLLKRARRVIPTIGGFDLSPIPVLILLQLIAIVVIYPFIPA